MSAIGFKLVRYVASDIGQGGLATYVFEHSTDGRKGTTLKFEVDLRICAEVAEQSKDQKVEAQIRFDGCYADSPAHALDRLGGWLQRAAEAVAASTSPALLSPEYEVKTIADAGTLPVGSRFRIEEPPEDLPVCGWSPMLEPSECGRGGGPHRCTNLAGNNHGEKHNCGCGFTWPIIAVPIAVPTIPPGLMRQGGEG